MLTRLRVRLANHPCIHLLSDSHSRTASGVDQVTQKTAGGGRDGGGGIPIVGGIPLIGGKAIDVAGGA